MDNAKFHHSYKLKKIAKENKITIVSAYSPMLNIIEYCLNFIKRQMRERQCFDRYIIFKLSFK